MTYTLVDAYLCRNLGDDLMVLELCKSRSAQAFVAPDLELGRGVSLDGVENLTGGSTSPWLRQALAANGYVMCGGSMFIDRRGLSLRERVQFLRRWGRRLAVALLMRVRRRPVEVIGCNVGPVETRLGALLFGAFLRLASRITVRDAPSEAYARRLGIRSIERAPDMVLSYLARELPAVQEGRRPFVVGVSIMEWPGLGIEKTRRQYEAIVTELLRTDAVAEVRLFGFQDRIVRDDILAAAVGERFSPDPRVRDLSYSGDVAEILQDYSGCTHVIAVRFHAGIIALGLGIPMVQFSYSRKIIDYLDSTGWRGAIWETTPTLGQARCREIVGALLSARPHLHRPASASIHASESSF